MTVGVSEKATVSTEDVSFQLPKFRHGLVIFGGVKDLEQIVEGSDELDLAPADIPKLFDAYVNTCPARGSRTVRTEVGITRAISCSSFSRICFIRSTGVCTHFTGGP